MAEAASNPVPSPSPPARSAGSKSIAALRRRFRSRPPSAITALDVDGQTLWVAHAAPRGSKVVITRVDAGPLELAPDADRSDPILLGQAIAKALSTLRLKPGPVVMGVPRAKLVLRTLTLPVIEDIRELASMVHFQVGKDLPFRVEDAVIDFKVHRQLNPNPAAATDPKAGDSGVIPAAPRLEVLVAAAQRDVVAFCEQTAEAAGLKLAGLGLRAYANARCVQACEIADNEDQAVALVSLRPDEVNIDVIEGDALLFSRGAVVKPPHLEPPPENVPAPETEEAAAEGASASGVAAAPGAVPPAAAPVNFVDAATIEVVRTLHGYGGMAARSPVAKVAVAGASGNEEVVVQSLSRRLSVPCNLLDPASALGLENEIRDRARGAIAAIGLALGFTDATGLPFDFLDPKRPAVQRNMRRIGILAGVAALAALFMVLLLVRSQLTQRRMAVLQEVRAQRIEAEKKRPIFRAMRLQAAAVEDWVAGERNWLQHYAYLSAILPPSEEVYVTSINISPQGTIRLGVQARSGEVLSRLDKQLRASGYEIKPLAITPGGDRHGYNFSTTVELSVPAKMTIDLAKVRPPARPSDDASLDPGALKGGRP